MTNNSRGGRIDRLEAFYEPTCSTCGNGGTRVVFLHDDHTDENWPEFCPECGRQTTSKVVIDLRSDDEDQEGLA
jgi:hypothetical protein